MEKIIKDKQNVWLFDETINDIIKNCIWTKKKSVIFEKYLREELTKAAREKKAQGILTLQY